VARPLGWTIDWYRQLMLGLEPSDPPEGPQAFVEAMRSKAADNPQYIFDDVLALKQRVTTHETRIDDLERQLREVGLLVRDLAERLLVLDSGAAQHLGGSRTGREGSGRR
jgi:hypothetical protein